MVKQRVLVCSAWPYASGVPHLGNLVSSLLSGDVFARYYRLLGKDVLYVSGTDAHGTRIEYEAQQLNIRPADLAELNHRKIVSVIEGFGIAFDQYTTTESPVHKEFVREIYLQMDANGYICTKVEQRPYCRDCKRFLADRFIQGTCPRCGSVHALGNQCDACAAILEPEELVTPRCTLCRREDSIEFQDTRHWYLDLPKLSNTLREYVDNRGFQGNVLRFTQQMIEEGLRPRAMTRDIAWGIAAPFPGAEGKVFYVWGEAALGYVSATIEHFNGSDDWKRYWFGDDVHQIYTQGKDNITFHTLIFPGQLIASGQGYHLPDQIAATEYLNWIGGERFSKSRGVGLYCDEALRVMDGELWRFYLLYNRPEGRDVNFSWEELEKAVNGVLISNVANLMNRVVSYVQTQCDHVVPNAAIEDEILAAVSHQVSLYEDAMERGLLSQALRSVCDLAGVGNEYFQRRKPWATQDASAVVGAFHLVKAMAVMLVPFVPSFASRILGVAGVRSPTWETIHQPSTSVRIAEDRVLLEKIDVQQIRAMARAGREMSQQEAAPRAEGLVSLQAFRRLDLRIGRIEAVQEITGANRLYQLTVNVGDDTRLCVAGIRESFTAEALLHRLVLVAANLEPTEIRGVRSECMILSAQGDSLALLEPNPPVPPGSSVS